MDLKGILDLYDKETFIEKAVMELFNYACSVLETIPESELKSQFLKGRDIIQILNSSICFQDSNKIFNQTEYNCPQDINVKKFLPDVFLLEISLSEKIFSIYWDSVDSFDVNKELIIKISKFFNGEIKDKIHCINIPLSNLMKDLANP